MCLSCQSQTGFFPYPCTLAVIEPVSPGIYSTPLPGLAGKRFRKCENFEQQGACNWMVPCDDPNSFCLSCSLSRTIPDLSVANNRELWIKLEGSKQRLLYTLLRLGLTVIPRSLDPVNGLAFDFLSDNDPDFLEGERIMTGHFQGIITINAAEADDAMREKMRLNLREVYRTLMGHFRHESGHYYWNLLVRENPRIESVRALFGDDRIDYTEALSAYYKNGVKGDWAENHVSPYASCHPWEDWAETWAHYLHIIDTLETASTYDLIVTSNGDPCKILEPIGADFDQIRRHWHALRFVLNSLNRSMGFSDPYPFVTSEKVYQKLQFVHEWISSEKHFAATA